MTQKTAPAFKAGDRVAMGIAPDLLGTVTEVREGGLVMFQADGQEDAYEFNAGSFVPA